MRLNNKVKQEDIAKLLDKSLSTIKRGMNKMIENGIITRTGGKRYGYWEINEK